MALPRDHRRVTVAAALAVAAAVACSSEAEIPADNVSETRTEAVAVVSVEQEAPATSDAYPDGAVSSAVITDADGDVVFQESASTGPLARHLLTVELAPGRYTVRSSQRACRSTCTDLAPPTDECEAPFEVAAGDQVTIIVFLTPGSGCTVTVDR